MPKNRRNENQPHRPPAPIKSARALLALFACALALCLPAQALAQKKQQGRSRTASQQQRASAIPEETMLRILRAEDERRWGDSLAPLLADASARVRLRAALAAGRIGDQSSVPALVTLLQADTDAGVRAMAAFALGETESARGADALVAAVKRAGEQSEVRARAVEAIGKIAAALPKEDEARLTKE
jgi:HEAT repeat protein